MSQFIKTDVLLSVKNVGLSFIEEVKSETEKNIFGFKKTIKKEKVILSEINFDILDIVTTDKTVGQVVSLVGKSGMGKTELIRILSGLPIHGGIIKGDVLVHHDKIPGHHTLKPVKEGDMGIVFQSYYMPEHLIIKNMLIKSAVKNPDYKHDTKLIEDAVNSYLNEFELYQHKDKFPCQLSGGQKQRASIIMQLLNGSNFLLMDEPFSGLDPLMIDKTTALLQKVADSDELKTLIIVSHDLVNCAAISDTIFVLSDKGRPENTGATISATIDLLELDLAYHADIKRMPEFHNVIDEVKNLL